MTRPGHFSARRLESSRAAVVRAAFQEHSKQLDALEKEAQDREGYRRRPQEGDDLSAWQELAPAALIAPATRPPTRACGGRASRPRRPGGTRGTP